MKTPLSKKWLWAIPFISLVTTVLAAVAFSGAWFTGRDVLEQRSDITGTTEGKYFAYGTGAKDHPYGISNQRHLYNLAWLQYMGEFNKNGDDTDPKLDTVYFELANDVDMSGYTALPPIGTSTYPFIGHFDGKGHSVKNLTVSNGLSDYKSKPYTVASVGDEVNIVGFFGVVGQYNNVPADGNYEASTNQIVDVGLDGLTVKSTSSKTLVGLACGYDNGTLSGVKINNAAIQAKEGAAAITSLTSNLSDYSLVGYATEKALKKMNVRDDTAKTPVIVNPNSSQGGTSWNSSVDMQTMYTNLDKVRAATVYSNGSSTSDIYYNTSETVTVHADGTTTTESTGKSNIKTIYTIYTDFTGTRYYRYEGTTTKDGDGNTVASFTISRPYTYTNSSLTSASTNLDSYIYISGYSENQTTSYDTDTITTNTYSPVYGMTITSNGQTFSYNSSTKFYLDNGKLYTLINGTKYYMNASGTSYSFSQTASTTTWDSDSTNLFYTDTDSTTYAFYYSSSLGFWTFGAGTVVSQTLTRWTYGTTIPDQVYIYDSTARVYMSEPSSDYYPTSTNDISSATTWTFDSTYWRFHPNTSSGSSKYLGYYSSSYPVQAESGSYSYYTMNSGYKMETTYSSRTYYIVYNRYNGWYATSTSSRGDTFELRYYKNVYSFNSSYTATLTADTSEFQESESPTVTRTTKNPTYNTNATYFPLTWATNSDGSSDPDPSPADTNTGYVVSGANSNTAGDIRVSRYSMSNLSASFKSNELNGSTYTTSTAPEIVTFDTTQGHDWTLIRDSYNSSKTTISSTYTNKFGSTMTKNDYRSDLHLSRYKKSREGLQNVLLGQSNIYGLHFMNAQISTDHLDTIGHAKVVDGKTTKTDENGNTIDTYSDYYNYEVPEDSIDFHLKSMGYINFFAGTYFPDNNTFFSLHKIERGSDNKISSIKEISKIYQPKDEEAAAASDPYVYVYSGETDSYSSNSAYKLVFDMSHVTRPTMLDNALYYFEIPVNSGEYALGSVSGRTGAYLIYLDIGAGTANYSAVTVNEQVRSHVTSANYPLGVDFASDVASSVPSTVASAQDGGESAAVSIAPSSSEVSMTFRYSAATSGSGGTLTCSSSPGKVLYQASGVDVKVDSTTVDYSGDHSTDFTMEREITQTYNVWTETITNAYTDTYTFTSGKAGDVFHLPKPSPTSGYTVRTAEWVSSNTSVATVSDGTVTFVGDGSVTIILTWNESVANQSEFSAAPSDNEDARTDEGTWAGSATDILSFHFEDKDKATVISYAYSYDSSTQIYTYTVTVSATADTSLVIDSVPADATHQVVIVCGSTSTTVTNSTAVGTAVAITAASA